MDSVKDLITAKSKLDDETGCWNWTKYLEKNGYAKVGYKGKTRWSHRLSYEAFVGPIPEGFDVCHRCDNRKCVNPNHLFVGSRLDNMKDAVGKNRVAKGVKLPQTKLTPSDKETIIDLAKNGVKYEKIGDHFGVCRQTAGRIAIQQGVRRHGLGK